MNAKIIAGACVLLLSTSANASPRDDVLNGLQKCAAVAEDKSRLACYDALAKPAREALARPPEPGEAAHAPTAEEQKSWFGFDLSGLFAASPEQQTTPEKFGSDRLPQNQAKTDTAEVTVDSISAGVTEYAYTPFGKFIVFLDNGQVWRQIQGESDHANFRTNPKDNKVTISRGFIGSYNLTINGSAKVFKVSRVK
jgi:hypothetical protein